MKKIKFEDYLEKLVDQYFKNGSYTITENEIPDLTNHIKELRFMESLRLLTIYNDMDGFSHIELTTLAVRYGYDEWNARKNAIFNYLFGLASGIAVGVSVALIVSLLGA